ncbi:MAG TPA: Uma2 family endonuclease [Bryobacteraceae bacterium]|jgi:Uma2 family endonuclease
MLPLAPLLELLPGPGEWTESDYFPLSERGRLVELSDGNIEVLPRPTDFHQLILLRLAFELHAFVMAHQLGQVRFAPLPVRLWPGKIREPDLMFMATAHADRIGNYWGVPDLAVEIVSEGMERHDRQIKREEYGRAGIAEYWIVDPAARSIEILRLGATGYDLVQTLKGGDVLTSPMFPDFSVALTTIFTRA